MIMKVAVAPQSGGKRRIQGRAKEMDGQARDIIDDDGDLGLGLLSGAP